MPTRDQVFRAAASAALLLSAVACDAPRPAATAGDASEADDFVWLSVWELEETELASDVGLRLVREDGTVAWSERFDADLRAPGGGIAFAAGPRAGRLAYGLVANGRTTLFVADAHEGASAEIAAVEGVVHGGVLSPDGAVLFLAVGVGELEILRLAVEPGAAPERVAAVPPSADEDVTVTPFRGLRLTPDGEHLLVERCEPIGRCSWFEINLASGESRQIQVEGAGRLIGIANDLMLTGAIDCRTGPCPYIIVDRESGAAIPWDPGAHNARLVAMPDGGSVLAYDTAGTGSDTIRISLVDPATLEERPLEPIGEPGDELGLAREGQDEWAPPGWLVLAGPGLNLGEQGGPVLVNAADGRVVRLPAPDPG